MNTSRLFSFALMLCLLTWTAFAQVYDLSPTLKVTQDQINEIRKALPTLKEDKVFYHWTNLGNGIRWVSDGKVDGGEVQFLNQPSGDRQVHGAGLYLADDPVSSKSFGSVPTAFTISKDTPLYDNEVIQKVLGRTLTNEEASKLGEHIPFVRETTHKGWFVTNSAQNTQNVKYAPILNPEVVLKRESFDDPFEVIGKLHDHARGADGEYLKRLVTSFEYMDGMAVPAAMKTNPEAPWKAFSPEGLDAFERTMTPGFLEWVKKDLPRDEVQGQLEKVKRIYASLSGQEVKPLDQIIRQEGVRAGGDEAGKRFLATEAQLNEMLNNPYLEVVSEKRADGLYLVEYFYPDAFHYKKLEGKISADLFKRLREMSPDELMKNHELRRSLNKEIIQELLQDLFSKRRGKFPQVGSLDFLQFQRDYISIHPFDDFNGRSVRMFSRIHTGNNAPLHYFFSDMDILTPLKEQSEILEDGRSAVTELRRDLIHEYLMAKSQNRMPDYMKTGTFEKYMFEASPGKSYVDVSQPEVVKNIQSRNWPKVFELAGKDYDSKMILLIKKDPAKSLKSSKVFKFLNEKLTNANFIVENPDLFQSFFQAARGENFVRSPSLMDVFNRMENSLRENPHLLKKLPLSIQKEVLETYAKRIGHIEDLFIPYQMARVQPEELLLYDKLYKAGDSSLRTQLPSLEKLRNKMISSYIDDYKKLVQTDPTDTQRVRLASFEKFSKYLKNEEVSGIFVSTVIEDSHGPFLSSTDTWPSPWDTMYPAIKGSDDKVKIKFFKDFETALDKMTKYSDLYSENFRVDFSKLRKFYEESYYALSAEVRSGLKSPDELMDMMRKNIKLFPRKGDLSKLNYDSIVAAYFSTKPTDYDSIVDFYPMAFKNIPSNAEKQGAYFYETLFKSLDNNVSGLSLDGFNKLSPKKKLEFVQTLKNFDKIAQEHSGLELSKSIHSKFEEWKVKGGSEFTKVLDATGPSGSDCVASVLKNVLQ